MFDVVKTSVLSKRWRNLWTTAPFLNFDNHPYSPLIRQLVTQSLFRWNGERILKFRLCYNYEIAWDGDIESCVMFAKEKGVEELHLHGNYFENGSCSEWMIDSCPSVPPCLYSCSSSLKDLSINGCILKIYKNENVQCNQLKSLTITQGLEISEDFVNKMLSGSPKLEVLNLSFVDGCEKLNIQSNSLKEVSICKYIGVRSDLSFFTELRIWAPNLETLKIEGIPWGGKCLLENVSSLKRAALGFSGLIFDDEDDCRFDGIPLENGFLSFRDFLGDNFIQVLQIIKHVDSVALFYCCPKVLGAMKMSCIGSSFTDVKSLMIRNRFNDYEQFLGLLEIFPELNRVVLQDNEHYPNQNESLNSDARSYLKFEASLPKSFLLQLRTVDITWSQGDNIFPFMEILLKHASKLGKMVLRVKEIQPPSPSSSPSNPLVLASQKLVASQKLLLMPRFSRNCKIEIL